MEAIYKQQISKFETIYKIYVQTNLQIVEKQFTTNTISDQTLGQTLQFTQGVKPTCSKEYWFWQGK